MKALQYYKHFRKNHTKDESMDLLLYLAEIKQKSAVITLEQYNRFYDILALKNNWKSRRAYLRNDIRGLGYKITGIRGDWYSLQNGQMYKYNELIFK